MPYDSKEIIIYIAIVTGIIVFLAVAITLMIVARNKREWLHKEQLESLQLKTEKQILESEVAIQENVLQAISREIHDNLTLSLTLAKLYLNTFPWDEPDKARIKLNDSVDILTKTISDLSDISKSLNSDIIVSQGLIGALEEELGRIKRAGLFNIVFNIIGDVVYMDNKKDLLIYRIIQEAFNNIIKHSKTRHAWLTLDYRAPTIHITIGDCGTGFIPTSTAKKSGAGLTNMRLRAGLIGGEVTINSQEGKGTLIELTIPII